MARTDLGHAGAGGDDGQRLRSRRRRVRCRQRSTPGTRHVVQHRQRVQLPTRRRVLRHRTVTYTIRDSHGLLSTGSRRCGSTPGTVGAADPRPDGRLSRRLSRLVGVGFTTAQLLANDSDPQGQPLTVVAVSEPSTDGVLTGTLAAGSPTRRQRRRIRRHRPRSGLPRHRHRRPRHPRRRSDPHPRRRRPQPTTGGRATMWRGRTEHRRCRWCRRATTSTPTATGSVSSACNDPAHGTFNSFGTGFNYTPNAGFSGIEPSPTRSATATACCPRVGDGVGRHRAPSGAQSPNPDVDYTFVYQGSSVSIHDRRTAGQRQRPARTAADRRRRVRTVHRRGPHRHRWRRVHLHTHAERALINTDHVLTISSPTPTATSPKETIIIRILAAGDPNQPPVAVPDTATSDGSTVQCVDDGRTTSIPTATRSLSSASSTPAHGTGRQHRLQVQLHTRTPGSPASNRSPTRSATTTASLAPGLATISVNTTATNRRSPSQRHYTVAGRRRADDQRCRAVDPDGLPLTWSLVTPPAGQLTGALTGAAPTLTYTAPANRPMTDTFVYEVSDGTLTAQATITITRHTRQRRSGRRR